MWGWKQGREKERENDQNGIATQVCVCDSHVFELVLRSLW
jgi:hypothetical protein